jgi:curved DNA-binding protein CbpA
MGVHVDDLYQLLGVGRDATPAVVKIAFEGRVKALARSPLDDAAKAAERKALERAFVTLSNPAKRQWYDDQLERQEAHSGSWGGRGKGLAIAGLVAVLAIGGASWALVERSREKERLRLEEERLALQRDALQKAADLEQARVDQGQQRIDLQRDAVEASRAARERAYADGVRRAETADAQRRQAEVRSAVAQAERDRQVQEARDRAAAEAERRRAVAEVERQKRFVQQREQEDERARNDRYARAQYEKRQKELQEALAKRQPQ